MADLLPHEAMRYLADSAHQPYGPQPVARVRRHVLSALDSLVEQGVKMLVIACNSAWASLADARERYDVPVVDVVLPAVRSALSATKTGRIGVIGTQVTIASRVYEDAFAALAPDAQVASASCPRFVDFIEEGVTCGPQLESLAREYLEPLCETGVDTLVLGCTHYPLLGELIRRIMGDDVALASSPEETAKDVARILSARGLARTESSGPANVVVAQTGRSARLLQWAMEILGPELVDVRAPGRAHGGCLTMAK
jgi:glutamate racemase